MALKCVSTVFKETTVDNQKVVTATTTEQEGTISQVATYVSGLITNNGSTIGNGSISIVVTEKEETT